MANIIINEKLLVKGKISFSRKKVVKTYEKIKETKEIIELETIGVLSTHLYIDEINEIETERCIAKGIDVYREDIGSDDYNILYHFRCEELEMKGVEVNIDEDSSAYYIITPKEIEMIEDKMYKNDHPYLGDIGEEYKHDYVELEGEEEED